MSNLEAYEHNLKLYYESKRKDLDILLTSTIPTQKNLMKTILWLNSSVLALTLGALSKNIGIIYISIPFIFSFLSILIILWSLKDGKIKAFGTPTLETINNIKQDENEKTQGLYDMCETFDIAVNQNTKIIEKRAIKLSQATNFTIISFISIFVIVVLFVNIHLMKGG